MGKMENGGMLEFPHHPCESATPTSDSHNFLVRTLIYAFLDYMKSSLSLEYNKMKCSAKTWVEQWVGSWTLEERSVLVSGTSVFGIGLYLKCSGLCMA